MKVWPTLPQYRVLAVDDNQANRQLLQAYLARLGVQTFIAENGQEALDVFDREKPDIVLLDVMMPVMDGLTAARKMRERTQEHWVPIVMLSALGSENDVVKGLESGADDYLVKPISYAVFTAKMQMLSRALSIERASERVRAQLKLIADTVNDGLVVFGVDGVILKANRACASLFDRDAEALVGMSVYELFLPDDGEQLRADIVQQRIGYGAACAQPPCELKCAGPDKAIRYLELSLSQLTNENGANYVGVLRDVSEQRRVERELRLYRAEAEHENALAQEIIERGIGAHRLTDSAVEYRLSPARGFSGDLVLVARSSCGKLFALLADAVGHGLAAAVSVLPAVSEFYRMVELAPSLQELVYALNRVLHAALPKERFVAATLISIEADASAADVWVGGMPDVFQIDGAGRVLRRFGSNALPLGVEVLTPECVSCEHLTLEPGQQLLACSDGVLEAAAPDGVWFGYAGIEAGLKQGEPGTLLAALQHALAVHCAGTTPHDDISMLLVSAVKREDKK
ncbi:MAG: SpoIIE family protein phosphatase [Betaproteobacteria bacterium]|nr:SpoIIE family protein phosphatase [Betaproteobacteria bacterium]